MSLNIYLVQPMPTNVFDGNITHNVTKMASQVVLSNGLTLYQVLWRPEEHNLKLASEISELLDEAFNIMLAEPNKLKEYEPSNGYGSYEGLKNLVYEYRNASWKHPDAEIVVSR